MQWNQNGAKSAWEMIDLLKYAISSNSNGCCMKQLSISAALQLFLTQAATSIASVLVQSELLVQPVGCTRYQEHIGLAVRL